MTSFVREPCRDCFRKDYEIEQQQDEIERLQAVIVSGDHEIKASHADCDRYRAIIEQKSADLTTLAQRIIERDEEIEQLKADARKAPGTVVGRLQGETVRLEAEIERLKAQLEKANTPLWDRPC